MITGSRARILAETTWGTGGTHSARTNRKGAFYYSCSGHGGYIVDGNALTVAERDHIDRFKKPEYVWAIINDETSAVRKTSNPFSTKRFFAHMRVGERLDKNYPIYYFEEDCDWSILEKFTDIRAGGKDTDADTILNIFYRWCHDREAA